MKKLFGALIFTFSFFCFGQNNTNWYAFYNADSTKIGYKDATGTIQIAPKFGTYVTPEVFKNVIPVIENTNEKWENYYLNKNGKIFGKGCVYMAGTSDFAEDSEEYEGIIKFRNKDGVGYFDSNGKIIIRPIYNDLTNFHNGIARGLRGAVWPKCNSATEDCEHIWWQGGKVFAINTKGEELFELPEIYSTEIDYKHPIIGAKVDPETYDSYHGKDGKTYSFLNPEKDFNKWFETVFLPDFKKNKTVLPKYFYDLISVDDNDNPKEDTAWKNHTKNEYLDKNQKKMDKFFLDLVSGKTQKSVNWEWSSSNLYFPENLLPKKDLTENTVISLNYNIQFTKIGSSYFITSAP